MSKKVIDKLVKQHGARNRKDIVRGVDAAKKVWDFKKKPQSQFEAFCLEQYVPPGKNRVQLLQRLDEFHNSIAGNMGMSVKIARAGQDIADRPLTPAESVLAAFSPDSHLSEDYRDSNISALAQLNFGTDDRTPPKNRDAWAARRMGDLGRKVVPAKLLAEHTEAQAKVDKFISSYNLYIDQIDFGDPKVKFPKGTKLISHWGLRDYMMEQNGQKDALAKQHAILGLMRRVVDGEIPKEILDNPKAKWSIPKKKVTIGSKSIPAKGHGALRWDNFRGVWKTIKKIDPYRRYKNLIDEKFEVEREVSEKKIVKILTDILSSPLATRVANFVSDQLGRPLEPFDIYYRDFVKEGVGKKPLKFDIKKKYPTSKALEDAIPDVLVKMGWDRKRAKWIGSKIRVDNGRSAGHAWSPRCPEDLQLLRCRVDKDGCDEINFETYMHELGHCVEGVLSSYELDYKALWSVPNTAFTEGFAFTFQDRTDEILGRGKREVSDRTVLLRFWQPFEIGGSALTEIRFFHWLYKNPNATAQQMNNAIRRIGDELWEEFYARIFGPDSHGLMSIYSHMLWGDFYLAEYPMGYVIAYQIQKYLEGKSLAKEMERMCGQGSIYPESWMKNAVGSEISVKPLLTDTKKALKNLGY